MDKRIDSTAADAARAASRLAPTSRNGGRPRRLVLIGPPGSGKGTQAQILADELGVPAISTGEMLRAAVVAESDLGRRVAGFLADGALVDDATMAEVVRERLTQSDAARGFLLDGYPRTEGQAATLEEILAGRGEALDAALLIQVPEDEVMQRIADRGRADDGESVARARIDVFREAKPLLVGYYRRRGLLREVDGHHPIEQVTSNLLAALGDPR
ncbi:MAG TPA: adenylate kinase [Thermoanaerobaculia bacterium]|nr:adenylate kinase [Thermoanaerobaculia bacterium]